MILPRLSFRHLFYLFYTVVLLVALLYIRFPSEQFKRFCEGRIEQLLPTKTCSIGSIGYSFPLTLTFHKLQLAEKDTSTTSHILLDILHFHGQLGSLFRETTLEGTAYSGRIGARLRTDPKNNVYRLQKISIDNVDLAKLGQSLGITDRTLTGTMSFSGELSATSAKPLSTELTGELTVSSGSMTLSQPILSQERIKYSSIKAFLTGDNHVVTVAEGRLLGESFNSDFSGYVRLEKAMLNSGIQLEGTLQPSRDLLRMNPGLQRTIRLLQRRYKGSDLPFRVGGTLNSPTFTFGI